MKPDCRIWAVTAYFNPCAYKSRRENYRLFRERLNIPLLAIELRCNDHFDLSDDDADIVVRVAEGSSLWQKERLLNVAVNHLPSDVEYIVFVDCDIIFERSDWADELQRVLEHFPVVQCYSELVDLPKDHNSSEKMPNSISGYSVAWLAQSGELDGPLKSDTARRRSSAGGAWAVRRDLIKKHNLYDVMVLGGADRLFAYACLGKFEEAITLARLGPRRAQHYLDWAKPLHQTVCGNIGVIEGRIYHLWHGTVSDRRYIERHEALENAGFDPDQHIALGTSGAWEWTSAAPASLRRLAQDHFQARNEDS
ncbi:hypothetical protein [Solimicrobium silvestre]|uniref:Glycosyl transferase family 2 n=1 Tax=Solimicrobium silvestre TaxID=2099400 RepID=A0A2S9H315_9BURK|nr:hypothetical protein [Solimicrobium silvestre]PRC94347.1 hypothetical protein S2091_0968 [Solimicrobium silvestre]